MTTQLSRRALSLQFQLGQGAFASGADTVDLTGLRVSASISVPGGVSNTELQLRAYGIPLDVMNRLTILGPNTLPGVDANYITVLADGALVFKGTIMQSWVDANASPDVGLIVVANTGGLDKFKPVDPSTYKGRVSAVSIIQDMASRLTQPLPVVNNGVNAFLTNEYHAGTLYDQIHAVAKNGGFQLSFDYDQIAMWPAGSSRTGGSTEVSAATGMVGYPTHTDNGISVTTLFNPAIRFGDTINVKSILANTAGANPTNPDGQNNISGYWNVFNLSHELESETPNGKWFSTIDCTLFTRPQ